jgi:hypothetical protein
MKLAYSAIFFALATAACGSNVPASESGPFDEQESELRRPGKRCAGPRDATCAAGEYCRSAAAGTCPDQQHRGVCSAIPEICTDLFDPVCGCDGVTYPNSCYAARSGAAVSRRGECTNNCQSNIECVDGQYCQSASGQCGGTGTCRPRPQACTRIYSPVCGCDGKTYGNECEARAAGVSVGHQGVCAPDGPLCGGFAGIPCAGGGRCVDDPSDSCDPAQGGADCGGLCVCVENVLCIRGAHFDPSPSVCACVPDALDACSAVRCAAGTHCVASGAAAKCEPDVGAPCGAVSCAAGQVCCNSSCGICTPPGGVCIQLACN